MAFFGVCKTVHLPGPLLPWGRAHTLFLSFNFLPEMQLILWNQPNYILKCVFHSGLYKTGLISICTLLLPLIPASARVEVGAPQSFYL